MDDFREWLSDNLRYFMLGGAILIIVVVLFCGIRACSGSNKGNSGDEQKTTSEDQGNVPSSPISEGESDEKKEDANPMETADAVRCRSQLLPGRSFPRKKLKSKGRSHFRNKKASF